MRFASIPTRGRKGAWHRVGGAGLLASGPVAAGAWHRFVLGPQIASI